MYFYYRTTLCPLWAFRLAYRAVCECNCKPINNFWLWAEFEFRTKKRPLNQRLAVLHAICNVTIYLWTSERMNLSSNIFFFLFVSIETINIWFDRNVLPFLLSSNRLRTRNATHSFNISFLERFCFSSFLFIQLTERKDRRDNNI